VHGLVGYNHQLGCNFTCRLATLGQLDAFGDIFPQLTPHWIRFRLVYIFLLGATRTTRWMRMIPIISWTIHLTNPTTN